MTQRQLNRFKVISLVIEGKVTMAEAAEDLKLNQHQIIRLKKGVIEQGPGFLKHKGCGRKPNQAIPEELAKVITSLKQSDIYAGANFLHFRKLLEEHESIQISYTPLYRVKAYFHSSAGTASSMGIYPKAMECGCARKGFPLI